MKVLGVDPGTGVTGWGVIEVCGNRYQLVDYGAIRPAQALVREKKYLLIFETLGEIIEKYGPVALAVETQFMDKNVQSAITLGMARGAVVIAAAGKDVPVFEYAPTRAKQAVTGQGRATKAQVGHMIKVLLGLSEVPKPEDASDALALAIAHAHYQRSGLVRT